MSKPKTFIFDFDIQGRCSIELTATSKEEALEKIRNGNYETELIEWDCDLPEIKSAIILMKYCANKREVEE